MAAVAVALTLVGLLVRVAQAAVALARVQALEVMAYPTPEAAAEVGTSRTLVATAHLAS